MMSLRMTAIDLHIISVTGKLMENLNLFWMNISRNYSIYASHLQSTVMHELYFY